MGFGDTSLLCKIVFILLVLCFIIDLIGFAIPYWISVEFLFVKSSSGLWVVCNDIKGAKECDNLKGDVIAVDWFRAVRAFSILSVVFYLVALFLVIIFMFFKSDKKVMYLVAVCLSFAGAFCAMIAFAVFAGEVNLIWSKTPITMLKNYGAGFALTIIAFILGLVIAILGILDYRRVVNVK